MLNLLTKWKHTDLKFLHMYISKSLNILEKDINIASDANLQNPLRHQLIPLHLGNSIETLADTYKMLAITI